MCLCVCVLFCVWCVRFGPWRARLGLLWWFGVPFVCLGVGVKSVVEALVVPVGLSEEVEGFEAGFPYFSVELFGLLGCKFHVC